MAKKQDFFFNESDGLNAPERNGGEDPFSSVPTYESGRESLIPETEEAPGSEGFQEIKEKESPESDKKQADGENSRTVKQEEDRAQKARAAWNQEARKVDGTQPGLAREAWDQEDRERLEKKREGRGESVPHPGDSKKNSRKKKRKKAQDDRGSFLKSLIIIGICAVLFLTVALMVVSNFIGEDSSVYPLLALPRKMVTRLVTPVQKTFSGVTDSIAEYVRMLKIRGNIEYQYEQLLRELDDYANQSAQLEELRRINESLYDLLDEQERNRELDPVAATVIGTDSSNYFSTLTLDVGTKNGVEEYMAVVAQGGLVGVTYNVEAEKCQVRCIINSDCTVAALIQSTRDQGSIKGTLGANGEAMCRMYYLPENALTRPGDMVVTSGVGLEFPKGIPIGEVRESTRGMEDNKSYVVVDPVVDFQHLEYVTVYRYKPAYAEAAQARVSSYDGIVLEPLSTPRAVPTFQVGQVSDFIFAASPTPSGTEAEPTPAPDATPSPTPAPSNPETPDPNATPLPENKSYQAPSDPDATVAPTPRPTFTPTPSPVPTLDPGGMTVEDE